MNLRFQPVRLVKRYPLAISRGVSTGSENLFVFVGDGTYEGVGEAAPGVGVPDEGIAALARREILELWEAAHESDRHDPVAMEALGRAKRLVPEALAALDIALWDLAAKRAGLPLYRHLGFPAPSVPTSVTIGINPPEVIRERVPEILARTGARALKVKLGNPQGVEADQAAYEAARAAAAPFGSSLRVDANGGWTLAEAQAMLAWLAERTCDYVEQPLPRGSEEQLPALFAARPLPIFADESCQTSADVALLADRVDGVNLKLMKAGGITEAVRLIHAAQMAGLKLMIGCMGESSVAISAGAALTGALDHVDLDSHLNLSPDPATGAKLEGGVVKPPEVPGHGAWPC